MKTITPINTARDDTAFAITARYGAMCDTNLQGGGHYPMTAILEIEMEEPKENFIGVSIHPANRAMEFTGMSMVNPDVCTSLTAHDGLGAPPCAWVEVSEPRIMRIGSYSPSSACGAKVLSPNGIAPTVMHNHGNIDAIIEPSILTPIRTEEQRQLRKQGIDTFGGRQLLPRTDGVCNTITTVQKDNLLQEPCVIGSMQANAMRGSIDGVSPCLTEAMGKGGGQIPMVTEQEPCGCYDNQFGEFAREPLEGVARTLKADHHNAVVLKYRIRKLTPTECLRLMDCEDEDIQKMLNAQVPQVLKSGKVKYKPLPKTAAYRLAGNSIVVSCLYHIFHQMFLAEPPKAKPIQKSLFD